MVIQYIERKLIEKSKSHRAALKKLGQSSENDALSENVILLKQTSQVRGMVSTCTRKRRKLRPRHSKSQFLTNCVLQNTIIQDIDTSAEDFIFYFDRIAALLVEK